MTFPQGVCLHHAAQKHPDNVALQNQDAQLFLQSSKHWMCTGAIQGWPILGSGLIIKWAKDIELHFCSRVYLEVPGVLLRMLRTIPSSTVKPPKLFFRREASRGVTVPCQHKSYLFQELSRQPGPELSCCSLYGKHKRLVLWSLRRSNT